MPDKAWKSLIRTLGAAALITGLAGTASAGSCISSVTYDGPSSKIFIYVKNDSSTSQLAIVSRAKNTDDIRNENGSYKELDRYTISPGSEFLVKDDTADNANKVYSLHMLSIYNMFRIQNDAGFSDGSTRYQGKEENMEYKAYNQKESGRYHMSCEREITSAAKWKITFKVTDR